jgi:DNA-directed RNA polymerase specialized sigma24 family protein
MTNSDTSNLRRLREGEDAAAAALWQRYFDRLAGLARHILGNVSRSVRDEEDVALSAFASFCRGVERGRYPDLADQNGLWRLLVLITRRKALDLITSQNRLKNGGGRTASVLALEELPDEQPTPEFVALMADQCRHLLSRLDDPELQAIALQKMEGYTSEEIAARHHCSLTRIERKLHLIRKIWEQP